MGSTVTSTTGHPLASFPTATVTIGTEMWLVAVADEPAERSRGLMGVTDLGDLDGMLFAWDDDVTSGFWMKDTLIPLDIAFFAADGVLVDLLRMEQCPADPCPVYHPAGPYRYAVETEVGRWEDVDDPVLVVPAP